MPRRNRDNLGNFLPNTHTASTSQPSLFFSGYELEETLGEKPDIFEEPTGEEAKITEGIERELRVPSPLGKPTGTLR